MANQVLYENHLEENIGKWFAIYTRYKREKQVLKQLEQKGIEAYLPLNKVVRKWERKVRNVELPLINCYVFVKIVKSDYIRVLETENVLNFVQFSRNLISIPNDEIDLLKRVTGEYGDIEIVESGLIEGDRVEILGGSLTGTKGKLVNVSNKKKFLIELSSLNYNLLIEVNASSIRKIV